MYQYKYPHPAVTTDAVVFGFDGKALHILLIERGLEPYKGSWALPGGFMKIDETVEECVARELKEETGVENVYLEQFHVFSEVGRDPRERVVTVAFVALVRKSDYRLLAGDDAARASWFELDELPPIAFDHHEIITMARSHLQTLLRNRPIAFKLLDEKFAMTELQRLYEAINDTSYDRRNFYKKMTSTGFLRDVTHCESHDEMAMESAVGEDSAKMSFCIAAPPEKASPGRPRMLYTFDEEAFEKAVEEEEKKGERKGRNPFSI